MIGRSAGFVQVMAALGLLILPTAARAAQSLLLTRVDAARLAEIEVDVTPPVDGAPLAPPRALHLFVDAVDRGAARRVERWAAADPPQAIVVVVHVGPTAAAVVEPTRRALARLAPLVGAHARLGLIAYATERHALTPSLGGPIEMVAAVEQLAVDNDGVEPHLFDALDNALALLEATPGETRRRLIVVSNGLDFAGDREVLAELQARARRAAVEVDAVQWSEDGLPRTRALDSLARTTHGFVASAATVAQLDKQLERLSARLAGQLQLRYLLDVDLADGAEHEVQVASPDEPPLFSNSVITRFPKHGPVACSGHEQWPAWATVVMATFVALGLIAAALAFATGRKQARQMLWPPDRAHGGDDNASPPPLAPVRPETPRRHDEAAAAAAPEGTVAFSAGPVTSWIAAVNTAETYVIRGGRLVVGRDVTCHVVIAERHVSSRHCELREMQGVCRIVDLDSANGVFVNDVRVRDQDLIDNDLIRIGNQTFRFKSIH